MKKITPPTSKSLIISVLSVVTKPVTSQLPFFMLLYSLLFLLDIFFEGGFPVLTPCFKIIYGIFLCYLLVWPSVVLPKIPRRIYKTVVILVSTILFIVDIYLALLYGKTFGTLPDDAIAAFLATNPSESFEFVSAYFSVGKVLPILAIIVVLFVAYRKMSKSQLKWNLLSKCAVFVAIMVSSVVSISRYTDIIVGNFYFLFTRFSPDLREYRQNPLVKNSADAPDNVVLVIGESFTKSHSSLFGYEKQTNPLLGDMADDSMLYVYDNVTSACITTIPAIKSLMTSYTAQMGIGVKWYECLTLLEVMQKAGYETSWISNQPKYGFHENETGRFADLCDKQMFVCERIEDNKQNFDEALLPLLECGINGDAQRKFFILQLMGSHQAFSSRYPENFAQFKAEDYTATHPALSVENRKIVSEYDNSILYNDSIVYEIIKNFDNKDAVVIYLSDHGQDIFESSSNYAGHAIPGNEMSEYIGRNIPFMVYTSPLFRERHPDLQERIKNAVNRPYRTDSIMYSIMDVAGVGTVNGVSYKHKSLFK